jgi:hypothetical protein
MTISAEKFPNTQRVCRMLRAYHTNIAQLSVDQHKSAQHKRAQKDLTQTCIARHKVAKLFGPNLQDFTCFYNSGLYHGSLSCDRARLAGEHSCGHVRDQPFAVDTWLDDLQAT